MKPVLIVEGKKLNVITVNYHDNQVSHVMVDVEGNYLTYYAENHALYVEQPLEVDMKKALVWENRYEPVNQQIQKKIDGIEEIQTDLAAQYIEGDELSKEDLVEIKRNYNRNANLLDGLIEALGIIDEVSSTE